jgi:hypothetical protein
MEGMWSPSYEPCGKDVHAIGPDTSETDLVNLGCPAKPCDWPSMVPACARWTVSAHSDRTDSSAPYMFKELDFDIEVRSPFLAQGPSYAALQELLLENDLIGGDPSEGTTSYPVNVDSAKFLVKSLPRGERMDLESIPVSSIRSQLSPKASPYSHQGKDEDSQSSLEDGIDCSEDDCDSIVASFSELTNFSLYLRAYSSIYLHTYISRYVYTYSVCPINLLSFSRTI